MKKRTLFFVAWSLVILLTLTACAPAVTSASGQTPFTDGARPAQEAEQGEYKGKIAMLQYINAHPYFQRGKERAITVGKELGYEVLYDGPADVDTTKFISLIEDYVSQDVDALIIAPGDDTAATVLKDARAKGIKVVTWDMDLPTAEARDLYAGLGDWAPTTGGPMVESLVRSMGETGKYAIIDGELSMHTAVARREYMIAYAAEHYPELELVAVEAAGEDVDKAYTIAQNLLTAYPDIKGLLTNTAAAFAPACKVVEENGLVGQVFVAGETTPSAAIPGFESGAAVCAYTWDTADWAEFALRTTVNLLENVNMPEGNIPDFTNFPGAYREGDVLYYGEAVYLTMDNVRDFGEY